MPRMQFRWGRAGAGAWVAGSAELLAVVCRCRGLYRTYAWLHAGEGGSLGLAKITFAQVLSRK